MKVTVLRLFFFTFFQVILFRCGSDCIEESDWVCGYTQKVFDVIIGKSNWNNDWIISKENWLLISSGGHKYEFDPTMVPYEILGSVFFEGHQPYSDFCQNNKEICYGISVQLTFGFKSISLENNKEYFVNTGGNLSFLNNSCCEGKNIRIIYKIKDALSLFFINDRSEKLFKFTLKEIEFYPTFEWSYEANDYIPIQSTPPFDWVKIENAYFECEPRKRTWCSDD